jgi:hypothetical protein
MIVKTLKCTDENVLPWEENWKIKSIDDKRA